MLLQRVPRSLRDPSDDTVPSRLHHLTGCCVYRPDCVGAIETSREHVYGSIGAACGDLVGEAAIGGRSRRAGGQKGSGAVTTYLWLPFGRVGGGGRIRSRKKGAGWVGAAERMGKGSWKGKALAGPAYDSIPSCGGG